MKHEKPILPDRGGAAWFLDGWYGIERSPEGVVYRASRKRARLKAPGTGEADLILCLSARPGHAGEPLRAAVTVGGAGFGFSLGTNGWTTRRGRLRLEEGVPVEIEVLNPWSPGSLYGNGDIRSLGILLASARFAWTGRGDVHPVQ